MNKTFFSIPGMDCSAEEHLIRLKLEGVNNITSLDFDLIERGLVVYHEGDSFAIGKAIDSLNLGGRLVETTYVERTAAEQAANSSSQTRLLWKVFCINLVILPNLETRILVS